MTFIIMMHYTWTGIFMGELLVSLCWILVLGKNIHLIYFVPLVLIYRMHPNICGELFRFLFIFLLRLDVSSCNLKMELFLRLQLLALSVPLSVNLVPSILWGLWI